MHILWMLLAITAAGCGASYVSVEQRQCLTDCSQRNDTCVVNAMNANALQACDYEAKSCTPRCDSL